MRIEVRLPDLGDGVTSARVGTWLKKEGERVSAGQPIVEVETDKTSVEVEAPGPGVLQQILIVSGSDGLAADAVLAIIADEVGAAVEEPPAPAAAPDPVTMPVPAAEPIAEPPHLAIVASHSVSASTAARASNRSATPLARKMAEVAGADLDTIHPSNGIRVTKADVERAIGKPTVSARSSAEEVGDRKAAPAFSAPRSTDAPASPYEDQPLSNLRRVTAARLTEAKQTVPHFYLQADYRIDALMDLRRQWNDRNQATISMTDLIVFAVARALRKVPEVNSAWVESALRVFTHADIAVAVNTPKGLITPVIREAERKSVTEISRELVVLAERARAGSLKPHEYGGGTFTISNLGMFGIERITPILNAPQACILGVGAIEPRPLVANQQIIVGHTMSCTLAADHRAIDGATAASFMAHLKQAFEDPMSLALDS